MKVRALLGAVVAVVAATLGTHVVYDWIAPSISLLFFPAIVLTAMYGGYLAGFVATVLSTISLAYYFVPPRNGLAIGIDDGARLVAFAVVSYATAWLGSARRRAEEAQRQSVEELRATVDTLNRIGDWPPIGGPDLGASVRQVMRQAADVLHSGSAVVVWETDDEPWRYVARTNAPGQAIAKLAPELADTLLAPALDGSTFVTTQACAEVAVTVKRGGTLTEWRGAALGAALSTVAPELCGPVVSAPFRGEVAYGRLFLVAVPDAGASTIPLAELVAREVSSSLEQLYLADRTRDLALREDRLRVSRDLHDGVLQALTGIRLQLQAIGEDIGAEASAQTRLLAIERALALEQRELRLLIDQLKPAATPPASSESLRGRIDAMCSRLSVEWRIPIAVRTVPLDASLPQSIEQPLRLMIHEAVVNALKHGHPSRVTIAIVQRPGDVQVTVSDDGGGFHFRGTRDHESLAKEDLGPVTLRERIATLGGQLQIDSSPAGSRVEFSIPLDGAPD